MPIFKAVLIKLQPPDFTNSISFHIKRIMGKRSDWLPLLGSLGYYV